MLLKCQSHSYLNKKNKLYYLKQTIIAKISLIESTISFVVYQKSYGPSNLKGVFRNPRGQSFIVNKQLMSIRFSYSKKH